MPDACGLGGDMLALVHEPGYSPLAINGTGARSARILEKVADDGPHSVTVPGIVDAWTELSRREGRLSLARCLEPAILLARGGIRISQTLARALSTQRARLVRGGAESWVLFGQPAGTRVKQPELAFLLEQIARDGREACWMARSQGDHPRCAVHGGTLSEEDFESHRTVISRPIETEWGALTIATQPPMTQGCCSTWR